MGADTVKMEKLVWRRNSSNGSTGVGAEPISKDGSTGVVTEKEKMAMLMLEQKQ